MKLNDLKDLKSIKKNFDPKPKAAASGRSLNVAKDFISGGKSAALRHFFPFALLF